nr:MAG TPA: hypothetical protein [Caudoviricetes sp.]
MKKMHFVVTTFKKIQIKLHFYCLAGQIGI